MKEKKITTSITIDSSHIAWINECEGKISTIINDMLWFYRDNKEYYDKEIEHYQSKIELYKNLKKTAANHNISKLDNFKEQIDKKFPQCEEVLKASPSRLEKWVEIVNRCFTFTVTEEEMKKMYIK